MAKGRKAEIDFNAILVECKNQGAEMVATKVTVGKLGDKFVTSKEDLEKAEKTETIEISLPKVVNPSWLGENAGKMLRSYIVAKVKANTQAILRNRLAGPDKALDAIEARIKEMGLDDATAQVVRATILAGLNK